MICWASVSGRRLTHPGEGVAEEEALVGGEAVDHLALLVLVGLLERVVRDDDAAEIGDVLAQGGEAADVLVPDDVGVELLDQELRPLGELGRVRGRPPGAACSRRRRTGAPRRRSRG